MTHPHIYTVHINPSLPHPYEAAEFIEESFSWKAFIFGGLWLLYHRLWWHALGIFALNGLLLNFVQEKVLSHSGFTFIHLGVHLFIGFCANDWRREKLKGRGYIIADIVAGDSLLRAEQRFFDRYFATHPATASAI